MAPEPEDDIMNEKNPRPLDEDDIALLKTYVRAPTPSDPLLSRISVFWFAPVICLGFGLLLTGKIAAPTPSVNFPGEGEAHRCFAVLCGMAVDPVRASMRTGFYCVPSFLR